MQAIETVAVLGGGEDGHALALLAALAGCAVRVWEPDPAAIARASERFRRRVELAIAAGALTATERQLVLDQVIFAATCADAAVGVDLAADPSADPEAAARLAAAGRQVRATTVLGLAAIPAAPLELPQPARLVGLAVVPTAGPLPRLEVRPLPSSSAHALERAVHLAHRANRAARHVR
jgi:3-hydroxybutyryl-CoA dehydrogenase